MAREMMDSMTKDDGPTPAATAPRSGPNGK